MDAISADAIDAPSNVLLVHARHKTPDACHRLRRVDDDAAELRVSFSNVRPDRTAGDDGPGKLGLVSVGDVLRAASADAGPDFTQPIVVDAIEDPSDLSTIGTSVSRFCEHWSEGDERITVCFRSLDAVLKQVEPETAFQFAHVLTNRLASVDALGHFHLDPTIHDDEVVSTFGAIFDEVVVDDSIDGRLPEASDEDVARTLEEWDDDSGPRFGGSDGLPDEATDEDIARRLEE